jgi:hypothetical protein
MNKHQQEYLDAKYLHHNEILDFIGTLCRLQFKSALSMSWEYEDSYAGVDDEDELLNYIERITGYRYDPVQFSHHTK